jgi:hypothetical protein
MKNLKSVYLMLAVVMVSFASLKAATPKKSASKAVTPAQARRVTLTPAQAFEENVADLY